MQAWISYLVIWEQNKSLSYLSKTYNLIRGVFSIVYQNPLKIHNILSPDF